LRAVLERTNDWSAAAFNSVNGGKFARPFCPSFTLTAPLGYVPLAEFEAHYHRNLEQQAMPT
jgi:hypothetical protein